MAFLKKSDAARELQTEVKSEEEWQKLMGNQGFVVVDAYTGWCGPCKAIVNIFRKIKNELGDDLLHFAIAETDYIETLQRYRGKSEPTFLFYGDGQLVNVAHGCDGPLITKLIYEHLKKEHQILEGTAEREIFADEVDTEKVYNEKDVVDEEEEELVEIKKQVAVALIKPDAVQAGLVDEIIEKIKSNGLEIIRKEERTLTKEEAAEFYKQHEGSEHFEQLISFMSSGPCMTLVVAKPGDDIGEDLLPEFRNLIGPLDVNIAKEEAPESIRAKYGTDTIQNAVHGCDSSESAARELAFFFPDFNTPVVQRTKQKQKRLQRTLALIRPSTLRKKRDSILKTIEDSGFLIAMQKEVQLERAQVEELYPEHIDKDYFENLVANMTCGPSLALCLAREDAVQVWRDMLGPKDIHIPGSADVLEATEAKKTTDQEIEENEEAKTKEEASEETSDEPHEDKEEGGPATEATVEGEGERSTTLRERFSDPEDVINPLHGADTEEQADREMNIFFPMQTTVAVIKPDAYEKEDEREAIVKKIKDAGFKISANKEVTLTKELASMFYKEHEGKEFFNHLTDYMASGPTQFLILSREDAVCEFRSLMGPTKPEEAKDFNPNSLRAQFGIDEMKNAIHGSSSVTKAKQMIDEFFPDIKLNEDWKIVKEENTEDPVTSEKNTDGQKEAIAANGEAVEEPKEESTNDKENKEKGPPTASEEPLKENEDAKETEVANTEETNSVTPEAGDKTPETETKTPEPETKTPDVKEEDKSEDPTEETKSPDQTEGQDEGEENEDGAITDSTEVNNPERIGQGKDSKKDTTAEESNGERSREPTMTEGDSKKDTTAEESNAETSREPTMTEGDSKKDTTAEESNAETSREPTMTKGDSKKDTTAEESNAETSREPTMTEGDSKKDTTAEESSAETSREPTMTEGDSKKGTTAEESKAETSIEPTMTEGDSKKDTTAEESNAETSREPTMTEGDSKKDTTAEESNAETSREPTMTEGDSKKDTTAEESNAETSREPTMTEGDSKKDTTAEESNAETSIEPTMTEGDSKKDTTAEESNAETSREPTMTEGDSKKDTTAEESNAETSREPTMTKGDSKKDTTAEESNAETSIEPTMTEGDSKNDTTAEKSNSETSREPTMTDGDSKKDTAAKNRTQK